MYIITYNHVHSQLAFRLVGRTGTPLVDVLLLEGEAMPVIV
jgi:hypothetical protein